MSSALWRRRAALYGDRRNGAGRRPDPRSRTTWSASFAPGRNFVTKLWNIGRFLLDECRHGAGAPLERFAADRLTSARSLDSGAARRRDRRLRRGTRTRAAARRNSWSRPNAPSGCGSTNTPRPRAASSGTISPTGTSKRRSAPRRQRAPIVTSRATVLIHAFDQALRLLQPIVPFVTDALWQRLPGRRPTRVFWPSRAWPSRSARVRSRRGFRARARGRDRAASGARRV